MVWYRLGVLKSKMTSVRVIPVPFRLLSWEKNITGTSFFLELVPLRGENEFLPHPQNEILVPFRGSFQNFRRSPPSLIYGIAIAVLLPIRDEMKPQE